MGATASDGEAASRSKSLFHWNILHHPSFDAERRHRGGATGTRGGGIGGRTAGRATAADASVATTARFTSATRASPSLPAADTTRERVTRLDLCFVARVETSPEAFFAARADGFAE
jgi:hypothetical protein